jgi:hypothetical protein
VFILESLGDSYLSENDKMFLSEVFPECTSHDKNELAHSLSQALSERLPAYMPIAIKAVDKADKEYLLQNVLRERRTTNIQVSTKFATYSIIYVKCTVRIRLIDVFW